jgi:hypothetical protein
MTRGFISSSRTRLTSAQLSMTQSASSFHDQLDDGAIGRENADDRPRIGQGRVPSPATGR